MTMVGLLGAGVKVVHCMHAEKSMGVRRMPEDAGALPECEVIC